MAEVDRVDALDERAANAHADAVAARAGRLDIALNAVGIRHVQGTPFAALSLEDYAQPIASYTRTNFLTAKAAARLLAAELAGNGIRINCLRPHAIPIAAARGSHAAEVFRPAAERQGMTVQAMLEASAQATLLKRFPTLDEVANAAVFFAPTARARHDRHGRQPHLRVLAGLRECASRRTNVFQMASECRIAHLRLGPPG